jgi:hypothetical protein
MLINIRRINALILTASLVSASCATKQPVEPELPYRTFSSISLISETELIEIVTPETSTERAKDGFQKGAAVGGVGGMAAGVVCGPFWGLCAGGFGLIGWLAGGVTGATYGFTGLSEQDSTRLGEKMKALQSQWDFQSGLVDYVKQAVPNTMLTEPELAEVHAILVVEGVEFINLNQEVVLETHARLTFTRNISVSEPAVGSKIFTGRSHASDIDEWLGYETEEMKQAMDESLKLIAARVATVLTERWAP